VTAQLEASNRPEIEEDLNIRIDKQAIEKYKETYADSKKTAIQESRLLMPPTSCRLM
jgi:hypothetical protein